MSVLDFSFDASYETLLGTNKPFPQPIPLSVSLAELVAWLVLSLLLVDSIHLNFQEMVDFLVDVWEQEGLYD